MHCVALCCVALHYYLWFVVLLDWIGLHWIGLYVKSRKRDNLVDLIELLVVRLTVGHNHLKMCAAIVKSRE